MKQLPKQSRPRRSPKQHTSPQGKRSLAQRRSPIVLVILPILILCCVVYLGLLRELTKHHDAASIIYNQLENNGVWLPVQEATTTAQTAGRRPMNYNEAQRSLHAVPPSNSTSHPMESQTIDNSSVSEAVSDRVVSTLEDSPQNSSWGYKLNQELKRKVFKQWQARALNHTMVVNTNKPKNTCTDLYDYDQVSLQENNRCIYHEKLAWSSCRLGESVRVLLHKVPLPMGNESVHEVAGRDEMAEFLSFPPGTFQVTEPVPAQLYKGLKKGAGIDIIKGGFEVVTEATMKDGNASSLPKSADGRPVVNILVKRETYANPCFIVSQLYSVFLLLFKFQLFDHYTRIIWLDGHAWSSTDSMWTSVFDQVLHINHIFPHDKNETTIVTLENTYVLNTDNAFLDKGLKYHSEGHVCPATSSIHDFRKFIYSQYNLSPKDPPKGNERPLLTFLVRQHHKAHPRASGKTDRVLADPGKELGYLEKLYPKHDIEMVCFENLSFRAQLEQISKTDLLVAIHGAGNIHVVFLPLHAGVVEYFPQGFEGRRRFRYLSSVLGLKYEKRRAVTVKKDPATKFLELSLASNRISHPVESQTIDNSALSDAVSDRVVSTLQDSPHNYSWSYKLNQELKRDLLRQWQARALNHTMVVNTKKPKNTCTDLYDYDQVSLQENNRCIYHEKLAWSSCRLGESVRVLLHKVPLPMGNESVHEVAGRDEMAEFLSFPPGTFQVTEPVPAQLYKGLKKGAGIDIIKGGFEVVTEATMKDGNASSLPKSADGRPVVNILVKRETYANPCFIVSQLYSVFLLLFKFQLFDHYTRIIWLDGHAWSSTDSMWTSLFDEVLHINHIFPHNKKETTIVTLENTYVLNSDNAFLDKGLKYHSEGHVCPTTSSIHDFRKFIYAQYNLSPKDPPKSNERPLLTFLVRQHHKAHPRASGKTDRVLADPGKELGYLEKLYPKHDIEMVCFENLSFRAQLEQISKTDLLVAIHGAGNIHVVFLPLHAGVVEYFPQGFEGRRRFRYLSSVLGLKYEKRRAVTVKKDPATKFLELSLGLI